MMNGKAYLRTSPKLVASSIPGTDVMISWRKLTWPPKAEESNPSEFISLFSSADY